MNFLQLPWLESALVICLIGSLSVSRLRDPNRAYRWGLTCTGLVFTCTALAWLSHFVGYDAKLGPGWKLQELLFGQPIFTLDALSAPLVPTVGLLHFLTALATARTKMRRYSFSWSLAAESVRVATFSCNVPWVLVGLLTLSTIPPFIELVNRGRPTRVYIVHMTLFVSLLVAGWTFADPSQNPTPPNWAIIMLLAAVLIRCGTVPAHCWVTDWFENASFGNALLYVVPLNGVYLAMRLVMPLGPDWVLKSIGLFSLVTAVYSAGMAIVQQETRRFYAYLFLSHASLVLVGMELHSELSLTASLCMWFSVILSLGGFGLTLRALEARFGRLSLSDFTGLYEHSPTLAVCFLLTGLASIGFPATIGFISTELLVDSAVNANPYVGIAVVAAGALNGIAVVRAYFYLFTGARHVSTVFLGIGVRERIAVLTLAALVIGGGLFPQPGVTSRQIAADEILAERNKRHLDPEEEQPPAHHTSEHRAVDVAE